MVGDVKLTYEELNTILTEIEAYLNFGPLVALPHAEDGLVALSP